MNMIVCDGGVDQQTQRVAANPGRLRDCKNFEVDTERGYKPIQGFARYDGRAYPNSVFNLKRFGLTSESITQFTPGEGLLDSNGNQFGTFVRYESGDAVIDVTDAALLPAFTESIEGAETGATADLDNEVVDATIVPTTEADWLRIYEENVESQRAAVEMPFGPIVGCHYFNDKLWVVRDPSAALYGVSTWRTGAGVTGNIGGADSEQLVEVKETAGADNSVFLARVIDGINNNSSVVVSNGIKVARTGESALNSTISDIGFLPDTFKKVQIWFLAKCSFSSGSGTPAWTSDIFGHATGDPIRVSKIVVESGSFAGGDAAGTVYVRLNSASSTANLELGEYVAGTSGTTIEIDSIEQGNGRAYDSGTSETDLGDFSDGSFGGISQLVKDTGAGWEDVELGYEVQFDTGTNEPQTVFDLVIAQTEADATTTTGSYVFPDAFASVNDGVGTWANGTNAGANDGSVASINYTQNGVDHKSGIWSDFGLEIKEATTIYGVEVQVELRDQQNNMEWAEIRLVFPDGTESNNKAVVGQTLSAAFSLESFGGEGDNWGANLTAAVVNDADFGVKLQFNGGPTNLSSPSVEVDYIHLRVYTKPATETVYFYNGSTDVATAELVYLQRLSGSWASNDAAGVATIRNIQTGTVTSGLDVYTGAGGTGNPLFTTTSNAERITLPGLSELEANGSRYQFIDDNFYAQGRLRSVYGVNGAGFAFSFNDDYFFRIRTGFNDDADDKPRHVIKHIDRLMLGYNTGEVVFSGAGEPANFEDTAGASDSYGSAITGLMPLSGEATAILTLKDVQTLQGSDPATWLKQYVSTESGAIEYTAVNMGSPIYCDVRGISTISATDRYGDFQRGRLSYAVEPWLRPRIQRLLCGASDAKKPVVALPIRSKSQYLLFFEDGYALSMTLMGDEPPQFMFRQYQVDSENLSIIAVGGGRRSCGQDRVFFSHDGTDYVYELDRGLSFDGIAYGGFIEFNATFTDPAYDWNGSLLHLHGEVSHEGVLETSTISDYTHEVSQDRALLRSPADAYTEEPVGFFAKIRAKSRGNNIALKLTRAAEIKPGCIVQAYQWAWPRRGKGDR